MNIQQVEEIIKPVLDKFPIRIVLANMPGESMASDCHLKNHKIIGLYDKEGKPTDHYIYDSEERCIDFSCGRLENELTLHRFNDNINLETIGKLKALYAKSDFSLYTPYKKYFPEYLSEFLTNMHKESLMKIFSCKTGGVNNIYYSDCTAISFFLEDKTKYVYPSSNTTYGKVQELIGNLRGTYKEQK